MNARPPDHSSSRRVSVSGTSASGLRVARGPPPARSSFSCRHPL